MKKLLLIEDELQAAHAYSARFAAAGFDVVIALDGESGLQEVKNVAPDVIVLDLILPGMSGIDVLKHLRANDETARIPVVVLTNAYLSQMISDAWRAGATKCLSKVNCTPKHVIEVVLGLLGEELKPTAAPASTLAPAQPQPKQQAAPAAAPTADADREFLAGLRRQFVGELPGVLAGLRTQLQRLIKSDDNTKRVAQLRELHRRLHALTGNAGIAGMVQIAQLSAALEALVKELHDKPVNINPSTLRTIALGIDFMAVLFERAASVGASELPSATALVADDESISRRAIAYALEKAKLRCVHAENAQAALKLLGTNKFDLIVLDIDLPDMSGFELCGRIRSLPNYAKTPVVFVTSLNDFEIRASSTISGGSDLIAKPFLFVELAVKALVYVMHSRLESAQKPVAAV